MRATFIHVLRYLGWVLVGSLFSLGLLLIWGERGEASRLNPVPELLVIVALFGPLAFVLIRAGVGAASGAESARVDRGFAVGLGRFVLGGAAGWLVADYVRGFVTLEVFLRLNHRGLWLLPLVLAGGYAGVVTGWLAWRRYGRILLPVSWALVFVLLVTGWLTLSKEFMHKRARLVLDGRPALMLEVAVPSPTPAATPRPA
jgi:hypothetical protein